MDNLEIERKYLVRGTAYRALATSWSDILQGYLTYDPKRSVRVRIKGEQGFITIKSDSEAQGLIRHEYEFPISVSDARHLLTLCLPDIVSKRRYYVPCGEATIEVDEFQGANAGLVMAEIELPTATTQIRLPDFIGEEVTGDERYYNLQLAQHPFTTWNNKQ